ncbi:MAG: hypothetical protein NDJ89_15835 [Oligoflexia bacterium]|nr:hypothetical protein [Oligoflexia bacterium]
MRMRSRAPSPGLWLSALVGSFLFPFAQAFACGAFPAGTASTDRVLSFLPSSGTFFDGPQSASGASAAGMLVFDAQAGNFKYCDGTSWQTIYKKSTATENAPAIAGLWGTNTSRQLGNGENEQNQTSPIRLNSIDFGTSSWLGIAAGESFSCGLRSDNRIFCWGTAGSGRLGNGTNAMNYPSPNALRVSGGWNLEKWKALSADGMHACAIRLSDNRLFCWGAGSSGQLGTGISSNLQFPYPLNPTGGWDAMEWKAVTTGMWHSCAIRLSDNRLFCWGDDSTGALGTGGSAGSSTPVPLSSTGGWDTTAWKSASVGRTHSCAIRLSDDRLFCWGDGSTGQLGTGDSSNQTAPAPLSATGGWDTTAWKSVSSGYYHTCAIRSSDDRLFCWGYGFYGQLGNGQDGAAASQTSPTPLSATGGWDITAWKSVSSGEYHTCAIRLSDDRLFCWGMGTSGRLGTGNTLNQTVPTALTATGGWDATAWREVNSGTTQTCARRASDERLFCWGDGGYGQLGTGRAESQTSPSALHSPSGLGAQGWKSIGGGAKHACGIRSSDDRIYCWGEHNLGQLGIGSWLSFRMTAPSFLYATGGWDSTTWKSLSVGSDHTCAIRLADDRLFCWGNGAGGRLGSGGITTQTSPGPLNATGGWDVTAWKSVSAGYEHTCGIRLSDNRIFCWGVGTMNRLGTGNTTSQNSPTPLSATGGWDVTAWKSVSAGYYHTCAIRLSDDRIFCWGYGTYGQLGNGLNADQPAPVALNATGGWDITAWKSVSAGKIHTCAIRLSDDRLFCWGEGFNGKLGNGATSNQWSPVSLNATGGWNTMSWKTVSAGSEHTCAIRLTDKQLFCWGLATSGQLGTGNTTDQSSPVGLTSTESWNQVAWQDVDASADFTIALEDPANFPSTAGLPAGVGANDLLIRFQPDSGTMRSGKASSFDSTSLVNSSVLLLDSANGLRFSSGSRWVPITTNSTATSCTAYPDATNTRVIELLADGSGLTYNATRATRVNPRSGSLIYDPATATLQYCDGTNWRVIHTEANYPNHTAAGTYSYKVPPGVSSIQVEAWGGGGGGGTQSAQANGGGGGGYSKKLLSVTPGETLTLVVGAGGATGVDGQSSSVKRGATVITEATGGLSAGGGSPTPTAGLYDVWYPGGAGAAAQGGGGGRAGSGGGGGGGSSGAGVAGTAGAGATVGPGGTGGATDGGRGGDGGAPSTAGQNGQAPGGGGGGSGSSSTVSGTGGDGRLRITIP